MKKNRAIIILTIAHALISLGLFVTVFAMGMRDFEFGVQPSLFQRVLETMSEVLLYPLFIPLSMIPRVGEIADGPLAYVFLLLNSYIWALVIWFVWTRWVKPSSVH